jgi:hypothetical protein
VKKQLAIIALGALALAGCAGNDNPLRIVRSACPAVGVLQNTGDVTLFAEGRRGLADGIDVVATITNVRAACSDVGEDIVSQVSYDVIARRSDAGPARTLTLPVFAAVMQGGDRLVAKQVGQVSLNFAEGQTRTRASATAQGSVVRAAATLPPDVEQKITRKRRAGDFDAAIDPMADPQVRRAVRAASFEVLLGFQLDEIDLAYNVTR